MFSISDDRLMRDTCALQKFSCIDNIGKGTGAYTFKNKMNFLFSKTDEITMFQKQIHIVCCEVEWNESPTTVLTAVVHTDAGPNLVRAQFLSSNMPKAFNTEMIRARPKFRSVQALQMNCVLILLVAMRENIARV